MGISALLMLIAGGLFAGGAATFAWFRVPVWRGMALPAFVGDFEQTLRRTDRVQPALLILAAVSAVGFALTAEGAARLLAAAGAAGFIVVLIASLAVLVPLQRRIIVTPPTDAEAIDAMRLRWFNANLGRALLSVGSFALMVAAALD